MLKFNNVLEHKVEDRLYKFMCAHDAPIGEIFDALCKMRGFVSEQIALVEKAKSEKETQDTKACEACDADEKHS